MIRFFRGGVGDEFGLGDVEVQREDRKLLTLVPGLSFGHSVGESPQVAVVRDDRMAEDLSAAINQQLLKLRPPLGRQLAVGN